MDLLPASTLDQTLRKSGSVKIRFTLMEPRLRRKVFDRGSAGKRSNGQMVHFSLGGEDLLVSVRDQSFI